jgi:hypothetical protein
VLCAATRFCGISWVLSESKASQSWRLLEVFASSNQLNDGLRQFAAIRGSLLPAVLHSSVAGSPLYFQELTAGMCGFASLSAGLPACSCSRGLQ